VRILLIRLKKFATSRVWQKYKIVLGSSVAFLSCSIKHIIFGSIMKMNEPIAQSD